MELEEEIELIAQAQRGDSDALAKLFHYHYSFLFKYCIKITLNKELTEDLVQDTFLKGIVYIRNYDGTSKFSSWLITIASRLYTDQLRKKKRERFWLKNQREQHRRKLKWDAVKEGLDWSDVMEAFSELEEEIRMPVLLKHYYGFRYEEIAEMLSLREGTVKSRVHNGLKKLRKELAENERAK
ncbi:RNA polymerase sigma factor SigY [Bacillus sp. 165]|uniref:RNA polymerase sigma factor SigY n=1 Tax=Bacillus sp. 165 TaxID=1529117 RepID=UPI001ADA7722|nr:RNA polymerase sigma factor SigY [Bacillus sp. 165]MBO9129160.1 RNA polymerase sigma factor SigY [Bacillus sp. 165]